MTQTRRDFLKNSSLIALGASVPTFLAKTALAVPAANQPGANERILVVVQLTGGNDGLNTVIPFRDDEYARLRPTLRQNQNQVLRINDDLGLHPSMTGLHGLLQDNALCIVQGVGYPNPTQSHFQSMDVWQAAQRNGPYNEGWIGRALRNIPGAGSFHLAAANEPAPLALTGAPVRVPSITSLQEFMLQINGSSAADAQAQRQLIQSTGAPANGQSSLLDFVSRTATNTYTSSQNLQQIAANYQPAVPYPNTALANRLKLAAQLINAGLGARLFYVTIDGFDTHANQAPQHANLLTQVSGAMTAFYRDLTARGHGNRVLMMTFSEFGRRAAENGSHGTDHGSGAPMLLVGGQVRSGPVGAHPALNNLEAGNLRHHTDFRRVYAAVLDNWLGVNSRQVLAGEYQPVNVFR
jgi:uncharacterized protein (DUF1501 family)